jgi:sugar porter (SP) family MFS transporter
MGAARGLDEGLIGTTVEQVSFRHRFGLDDPSLSKHEFANMEGNITSMVQLGSILGALIGFYLTDKLGRKLATVELCIIWVLGIAIFLGSAPSGNMGMAYAGRFSAGVGIGQTTIVAPTYLAETAPRAIRGLCVCVFAGCVYLGIMLSYFASWGSSIQISDNNQAQWLVPNSMHIMFAGIILILSAFTLESPRWLIKVGKHERAARNLSKLRKLPIEHPYVQAEIIDINGELDREREATMGTSKWGVVKELLYIPANRYRIMLSIMSQILAQWSGANSITIYAPRYFAMVGTTGQNEKLFATAIFGVVKFVSAIICAAFLIDFIGRKRALYIGISLQFVSMLYMALFLVIDQSVGDPDSVQSPSQKRAATGAIVFIYLSGFGWVSANHKIQC